MHPSYFQSLLSQLKQPLPPHILPNSLLPPTPSTTFLASLEPLGKVDMTLFVAPPALETCHHHHMRMPLSPLTLPHPTPSLSRSRCTSSNLGFVSNLTVLVAYRACPDRPSLPVFPPFWILGAIILLSPLTAPADFEPSKSEDERQQLVHIMRETEVKWAKRCAFALLAFVVLLGLVAGIAVAVMHS